eukprot:CAMPEP_0201242162 /NCGR_PEP_ID=MMETSP0852-20130820/36766_1 /ASSEMBLY_ACC=CAM_ASM_000632 /TAXON_ID=183588 /ORGANISM="Pseudo-nitzschia fraudulenta, Strain WWA7" /LENGTH=52 /DNA_ID=CAMNT_0047538721 /DNA_START=47 /DNA_END=202 /DNA_ORIENTATION=-
MATLDFTTKPLALRDASRLPLADHHFYYSTLSAIPFQTSDNRHQIDMRPFTF